MILIETSSYFFHLKENVKLIYDGMQMNHNLP